MNKLTWRDVLDCKIPGASLYEMPNRAIAMGYDYFAHNGWIYDLKCMTIMSTKQLENENVLY